MLFLLCHSVLFFTAQRSISLADILINSGLIYSSFKPVGMRERDIIQSVPIAVRTNKMAVEPLIHL